MSRVLVDSGIKWIGSLPNTWSITTVNKIFYRRKEVNDVENPTVLSLARDGVKIRDISTNEGQLAESYDNYHKVYKDDLMINPMDLISGANCSLSEVEGVISPAYINLAKKENIYPKYYDYFFKYQYWINAMFIHGKGVSFDNRWTMNWETMSSYKLPFPKYEEQKKIAIYLNDRCSKIDEIIEDNNKEIELLKEYKQQLISKNTSNGVKTKLKYVFKKVGSGTTPDSNDSSLYGNDIFWIQSGDINGGYIIDTNKKLKKDTVDKFSALKIYKAPFIVIAMYGGSIGNSSISNIDACTNQACCVLSKTDANLNYIFYSIKKLVSDWLSTSEGGTQPNVNRGKILNSYVNLPTKEEQDIIVEKLDQECSKLDEVIEYRKKIIEKLEEYKRSLIYECVTGKREV